MIIDSHAHMDSAYYYKDRDEIIKTCYLSDITIINVGTDYKTSLESVNLAMKYENVYAAVGVHPSSLSNIADKVLCDIEDLTKNNKVVAFGEIGLDYRPKDHDAQLQKKWFKKQLIMAKDLNLPVIIHARKCYSDMIQILKEVGLPKRGGVVHSYEGNWEFAKECIKSGLYISFFGNITYDDIDKDIIEVVEKIDKEKMLVETDSPYVSPYPDRSKRNNPMKVKRIIEKIAQIRNIDEAQIAQYTSVNAKRLFRI